MWYFFSVFVSAIGRMLIRPRNPALVDPGEHVRRPAYLVVDDAPGVGDPRAHALDELLGPRVHGHQPITAAYARPHLRLDDKPRGGIDLVFLANAANTDLGARQADLQRIDGRDMPVPAGLDADPHRRHR